jgi:hypothetical protein
MSSALEPFNINQYPGLQAPDVIGPYAPNIEDVKARLGMHGGIQIDSEVGEVNCVVLV